MVISLWVGSRRRKENITHLHLFPPPRAPSLLQAIITSNHYQLQEAKSCPGTSTSAHCPGSIQQNKHNHFLLVVDPPTSAPAPLYPHCRKQPHTTCIQQREDNPPRHQRVQKNPRRALLSRPRITLTNTRTRSPAGNRLDTLLYNCRYHK